MRHAHAGGTERHLNQVSAHLASLGHEVTILCRTHEAPAHPAIRFEVLKPFSIGATWRVSSFARAVERHLQHTHYDVVYGMGRTWTQDVLRLGGGSHASYLELAHAATRVGHKRWTTLFEPKHAFALRTEQRALHSPQLQRVVVNARMVQADIMRRYGLPPERFELIYNGVDLQRFHPRLRSTLGAQLRAEWRIAPDAPLLLFLGSGYARKGLDTVLQAFAGLRQHPSARTQALAATAHLLVVGYDSAQANYQNQAEQLGLASCTHFLGGRRDTERCYAAADLYLLPTRYDPFANTTLEALASGLPVMTTQANGAHELLQEGVHGSVFGDGARTQDWTASLARWLEPERLAAGAREARRLAEQHSVEAKMAQTAQLLEAVAQELRSMQRARG